MAVKVLNQLTRFWLISLVMCIIGTKAAYTAELQCELVNVASGKCAELILRGPILAEPSPGKPVPTPPPGFTLQGTEDNPIVPKTQADINNALPGSWIKDPRTGALFIRPGDYEMVENFLRKNCPELTIVDLISNGGSAYEAMKIGRLLRKYLITTDAPRVGCGSSECVCASACAFIWFGGVERLGSVGLHRPRIDDLDFASQPPEEATKLYRSVLNNIESYLEDMEVPQSIIAAMVATSGSNLTLGTHGLPRR